MIEKLCKQIVKHDGFQRDYDSLSNSSALLDIRKDISVDIESVMRLLKSATTFALSDKEEFRRKAYSIAVMTRNILPFLSCNTRKEVEAIIVIILSRLGNFPAEKKFKLETSFDESILPTTFQLERQFHIITNENRLGVDRLIVFTDFQNELWSAIHNHKVVIVNAPTSAGKSFVLQNFIISSVVSGNTKHAIYIVPSRALIEQVVIELKEILNGIKETSTQVHITAIPQDYSTTKEKIVYVLTQERVQLLLETNISIELVVIDEAQNISDGARGIILQSVIESIINLNHEAKFIFAMPFVKNPDVFLSIFNLGSDYQIIPSAESPVKQNLFNIVVDIHATNKVIIEQIKENGNREYLFNLNIDEELTDEKRYLAIISTSLGKQQNNIVFGSEPSQCEKTARYIIQLLHKVEDEELIEFSNYIKEHIHSNYLLAETILYGVAYHYGVLPSFIRKEIERLAVKGKIKYIVCTSTLLQGVNLPAQNIFIMKPSKGRGEKNKPGEMEVSEFWNLVGRAGRLTKDYEGNVFLINIENWNRKFIDEPEKNQSVYSSYQSTINHVNDGLLGFIDNTNHPSGLEQTQSFENSFMKLLNSYFKGGVEELSTILGYIVDETRKKTIINKVVEATKQLSIPNKTLMLNPNVSAYRQQEMVDYLNKRIEEKGFLYLIPPHPMKPWESIKEDYIRLFIRFGKIFKKDNNSRKHSADAFLALNWMRGVSYSELLKKNIDYKKVSKNKDPNVNTVARALFSTIERLLRFEYVKYSKCYNDLLRYVISKKQIDEKIPELLPLHLYLELGACVGTQISLIGLGFSRTSAAILSQHATKTSMNEIEVQEWLETTNLNAFDLPNTIISEVNHYLGK